MNRGATRQRAWVAAAMVRGVGIVALVAQSGCNPGAETAERIEAIRLRACACPDNACGQGAARELRELIGQMADDPLSEAHADRVRKASREATICLMRLGVSVEDSTATSATSGVRPWTAGTRAPRLVVVGRPSRFWRS